MKNTGKTLIAAMAACLMLLSALSGCGNQNGGEPGVAQAQPGAAQEISSGENGGGEGEVSEADRALFEQLGSKNSVQALFSRHSALLDDLTCFKDGSILASQYFYAEKDLVVNLLDGKPGILVTPELYARQDEDLDKLVAVITESADVNRDTIDDIRGACFDFYLSDAVILQNVTSDAQAVKVTTVLEDSGEVKSIMDYNEESYGAMGYEDGMSMVRIFTFDKNNGDLLSVSTTIRSKNGNEVAYQEENFSYDTPYDPAAEDSPFAVFYSEGDTRTVKVIYGPGTDEETEIIRHIPKGIPLCISYKGEYLSVLYSDPECTRQFVGNGDYSRDLVLYVNPEEAGEMD